MMFACEVAFPPRDESISVACTDRLVLKEIATRFSTPGGIVAALNMVVRESTESSHSVGTIHLETTTDRSGLGVEFSGSATTRRYVVEFGEIAADTYTVVLAVLQTALLPKSIIAFHAAFVDVHGAGVVIAGPSGAGKTSTSVAARAAGFEVFSGEITFIGNGWVQLGESNLAIAAGAVERFGLSTPDTAERRGANWVLPLPTLTVPRRVDIVVFPRVGVFPHARRRISRKSAEVQAFESVTSQASIWRVVGNRTEHVSVPWNAPSSVTTISQAFHVCGRPTWLVEGTPQAVVESIVEIVADEGL